MLQRLGRLSSDTDLGVRRAAAAARVVARGRARKVDSAHRVCRGSFAARHVPSRVLRNTFNPVQIWLEKRRDVDFQKAAALHNTTISVCVPPPRFVMAGRAGGDVRLEQKGPATNAQTLATGCYWQPMHRLECCSRIRPCMIVF